jgi:crotonobetainyl-CoA:carnitine CoA-transferase CaiB-like acyl-CoA transferase
LGVQYAVFEDVLPALVWLDLTPFGSDGPWADFAASALTVHAASGAQYIQPTGQLNAVYFGQRPPLKWGSHASEFLVATQAATALMAALFEREFRGRGQRLEISKQEALMQIIRSDIAEYANNGVVRSRAGSPQQGEILISGTMRCRDGYVAMWPLEPYMVVNLARLMGDPPWSKEAWFENPFERANHAAEIRKDIENWLLDFTMEEIHELGQTNRIAVTPVFSPKEVARSPQLASRGFFAEAYAADGRPFPLAGLPFPSDFGQPMAPPPEPGQDNLLVYRDILGLSLEELNRLEEAGVI